MESVQFANLVKYLTYSLNREEFAINLTAAFNAASTQEGVYYTYSIDGTTSTTIKIYEQVYKEDHFDNRVVLSLHQVQNMLPDVRVEGLSQPLRDIIKCLYLSQVAGFEFSTVKHESETDVTDKLVTWLNDNAHVTKDVGFRSVPNELGGMTIAITCRGLRDTDVIFTTPERIVFNKIPQFISNVEIQRLLNKITGNEVEPEHMLIKYVKPANRSIMQLTYYAGHGTYPNKFASDVVLITDLEFNNDHLGDILIAHDVDELDEIWHYEIKRNGKTYHVYTNVTNGITPHIDPNIDHMLWLMD